MNFELKSDFAPMGDQPEAIEQLVAGIESGQRAQVLLGVTGLHHRPNGLPEHP